MPLQRLKTRPQFQAVLAGFIVSKTDHFALHRNRLDIEPVMAQKGNGSATRLLFRVQATWIGAVVPKRWAKRAVTRNLIKRQIYSVSDEFSQHCPLAAFVVRLRHGFARTEFVSASSAQLKYAVRTELRTLMREGLDAT